MMLKVATFAGISLSAALIVLACDDHDHDDGDHSHAADAAPHTSKYPLCNDITQACHKYDLGDPGVIHDCHELAHGATKNEDCQPRHDECLATCAAAGADAGDGGPT